MASQTTVEVTQQDIDKAIPKDSSRCAVATAIARRFPKANRIVVDMHAVRFTNGGSRYTYLTPPAVADYIVAFDAGDSIRPFKFRLRDDQRLIVKRNRRTDDGKALDSATNSARYAEKKAERIAADPAASEAQKTAARERAIAAEHQAAAVRAEVEAKGEPKSVTETHPDVPAHQKQDRAASRRVFRRNERAYGARVLRVNNDPGPGDFRGPLDVE